jgi:hypothetical protein
MSGRNHEWVYLYNDDVLSMPDKWEFPWFTVWDLAFHVIPLAMLDPDVCQTSTQPLKAGMVYASQRATTSLRMSFE